MRPKYKHLAPADTKLWDAFLEEHGREYLSFEYDVHVGKLWPELLTIPEPWVSGAESVYLRRIDAVGHQSDIITVFEVKPHAGISALGQAIAYRILYEETFSPPKVVISAVVTSLIDPNIQHLLEKHGIEIYIYPFPII